MNEYKKLCSVLIFKDGAYWLTTEIWALLPGEANDHNHHLMGYALVSKADWYYYGIDRDGFESVAEAFSYLSYKEHL